jgi:hypothetical protein
MPSGHPSWMSRLIGLALARRSLRRTLEASGPARRNPLDSVLTRPPVEAAISPAGSPRRMSRGTGWSRP